MTVREAMAKIAFRRGELWLVRNDSWPPGRWRISADPHGPYDWRVKLHGSRSHIEARYRADEGKRDRENNVRHQREICRQARALVDKVRRGA